MSRSNLVLPATRGKPGYRQISASAIVVALPVTLVVVAREAILIVDLVINFYAYDVLMKERTAGAHPLYIAQHRVEFRIGEADILKKVLRNRIPPGLRNDVAGKRIAHNCPVHRASRRRIVKLTEND